MKRFAGWMAACCLFSAPAAFAEDAVYRVAETAGKAEYSAATGQWSALRPDAAIVVGTRLRTGPESWIDLVRGVYFENAMHVGPSSTVAFLSVNPVRISVDAGSVYVLKEDEHELRILSRDVLVSLREGGIRLDLNSLKVFADSVEVFPKADAGYSNVGETVDEGYQLTAAGLQRMDYDAYLDWKAWYKTNEKRRDDAGIG